MKEGKVSSAERVDDAIARLRARRPTNPKVLADLEAGRNIITLTNVAKEAGVSRTLIGHATCPLRAQRMLILRLGKESGASKQAKVRQRKNADERRALQKEVAILRTIVASQAVRIHELEGESSGLRGEASRFRKDRRIKKANR